MISQRKTKVNKKPEKRDACFFKWIIDIPSVFCYNTKRKRYVTACCFYGCFLSGELSEWSKVQHSKCCVLTKHPGFESLTLRQQQDRKFCLRSCFFYYQSVLYHFRCVSCRQGVCVYLVDDFFDADPYRYIGKYFNDAALIGEGRLLQNGHILHQSVMNDILHDLIDKIDLTAVEVHVIQEFGKRGFGGVHIKANDLTHELTQRLRTVLLLIFFLCAKF